MNLCPAMPALSTYIDGGLARIERAIVSNHLEGCERCRGIVDVVRWSLAQVEDEADAMEGR